LAAGFAIVFAGFSFLVFADGFFAGFFCGGLVFAEAGLIALGLFSFFSMI